jgi:Fe-S-cluster containining protein
MSGKAHFRTFSLKTASCGVLPGKNPSFQGTLGAFRVGLGVIFRVETTYIILFQGLTMPEEYVRFECKVGECIECCINPSLAVPVTLPDLYRASVYSREFGDREKNIEEIFDEVCGGWTYFPDIDDSNWIVPVPKLKMPCPYLDTDAKECTIHDTHQLVACRQYPESMLIEAFPGFEDSKKSENFWKTLLCMQGVSLSPERERELKDLCDLASREVKITVNLLHSHQTPVSSSDRAGFEMELSRRIGYISSSKDALDILKLNMKVNMLLRRYMDLFGIEEPDYTAGLPDEREARRINDMANYLLTLVHGSDLELRKREPAVSSKKIDGVKIGRNDPCPCGSGLKFKKCCGGC